MRSFFNLFLILLILTQIQMVIFVTAQEIPPSVGAPQTPPPNLRFSTRASSEIVEQDIETVFPVFVSDDISRLVIGGISYRFGDDDRSTFSGGLGFGYIFADQTAGLRARIHGDVSQSANGIQNEQLSFGFDLITQYHFDIIGNWYLPNSDASVVGERFATTFDAPFAQEFSILQGRNDATFTNFERGLEGGDIKIRFDSPYLENLLPITGYVGAYSYQGRFQADIEGFTGGLNAQLLNGVNVGAEYYDDVAFYGENWVFHTSVSIPLDGQGGFIAGVRNAFSRIASNREHTVQSKMFGGFDRRSTVMTEVSDPILTSFVESTDTLATDIIFVNNGAAVGNGIQAGSAMGDGSAENPAITIQGGAAALVAQLGGTGTVYVQNGAYASVEDQTIEVGHGVGLGVQEAIFTTSAIPIATNGGLSFGGDTARPMVTGGFDIQGGNPGTADTDKVTIEGFEIGGGNLAISTSDVRDVTVKNNSLTSSGSDVVELDFSGEGNQFLFTGNTLIATVADDQNGLDIVMESGSKVTGVVSNNTVSGFGATGVVALVDDDEALDLTVSGNSFVDNNRGLRVEVDDSGSATVAITGNEFMRNEDAVLLLVDDHDDGEVFVSANIQDNVFRENDTAINANFANDADSDDAFLVSYTLDVVGNQFFDNTSFDVLLVGDADSDTDGGQTVVNSNISENTFSGSNVAVRIEANDFADEPLTINATVTGNSFLNVQTGLSAFLETDDVDGSDFIELNLTATDNTFNGVNDAAISVELIDQSFATATIANNTILDVGNNGIIIIDDTDSNDQSLYTIGDNTIIGLATSTGISISDDGTNITSGIFGNNFISNTAVITDLSDVDGQIIVNGVPTP